MRLIVPFSFYASLYALWAKVPAIQYALSPVAPTRYVDEAVDGIPIPALESLKAMGPEQDAASIERWIRKLNKGEPVDGALADRVDTLEERYRKMHERLGEIEGGA